MHKMFATYQHPKRANGKQCQNISLSSSLSLSRFNLVSFYYRSSGAAPGCLAGGGGGGGKMFRCCAAKPVRHQSWTSDTSIFRSEKNCSKISIMGYRGTSSTYKTDLWPDKQKQTNKQRKQKRKIIGGNCPPPPPAPRLSFVSNNPLYFWGWE